MSLTWKCLLMVAALPTNQQTTPFNDPDLWPEDKSQQPFVWSTGDEYVFFSLSGVTPTTVHIRPHRHCYALKADRRR